MPWPVYLAYKHLFPTGRRLTRAAVFSALRTSVYIATAILVLVLGGLWFSGGLARFFGDSAQLPTILKYLGIIWGCLTVAVLLIALLFLRTSFFYGMSIMGVMLGVMVLLTVQSVMNGFQHEYKVNLIHANGHINIRDENGGLIASPQEIVQLVQGVPGVVSAEPVVLGMVMLQYEGRPAFPMIRSVTWPPDYPRTPAEQSAGPKSNTAFPGVHSINMSDPNAPHHPLADMMIYGSFNDLTDDSVLLGSSLAGELGVEVGDKVDVYTPQMINALDKKNPEVILPSQLTVAGIFQTGWTVADESIAVTLRTMKKLYGFGDQVHFVEVRLDNDDDDHALNVAAAINEKLATLNHQRAARGEVVDFHAFTWLESHSDLLNVLFLEKSVMFYIMIFIVIVAAFSIVCSLVTSVVRKTREIGVLGALGARPSQVALVFCLQGIIIGVAGTLLGIGLAAFVLHYRQTIVEARLDPRLLREFYKFLSFPVEYRMADFMKIIGFTLLITTLAGLLPAWWAARLKPADCLRHE